MLDDSTIGASAYVQALRQTGVTHFVTVPDFVQLALHQSIENDEGDLRLVRTCNEDQAVCTAAGLTIAGKRPLVVIQNQGLYACVNTIRAVALDAQIPTVLMIGQFGREASNFDHPSTASRRRVVRLLEPLLTTLGVPFWCVEQPDDLSALQAAFDTATSCRGAAAVIVGRPIGWH